MSSAAPPPDSAASAPTSCAATTFALCRNAVCAGRRAPGAAGALCLQCRDLRVRDQVSQPLPGEIRLQWWTDMLSGQVHGSAEGNPVAAELLRRSGFRPAGRAAVAAADEHQFDLYNDPMPTMAALEGYLDATSSALFALAAGSWRDVGGGRASRAACRARAGHRAGDREFCRATRRTGNCSCRSRCWRHGCEMEDVFAGKETPNLRAVLDQLVGRSRAAFDDGLVAVGGGAGRHGQRFCR